MISRKLALNDLAQQNPLVAKAKELTGLYSGVSGPPDMDASAIPRMSPQDFSGRGVVPVPRSVPGMGAPQPDQRQNVINLFQSLARQQVRGR